MDEIDVPEAHSVTRGSSSVLVGDIDTGGDVDHPDLEWDPSSVSCESGTPVGDPAAWDDKNGHGTHTAGTIAARLNGIGINGVAPGVRIAAIKSSNDDGYFFPEMAVCSFMYAGRQGMDVTNNSYYVDPWRYNCRNDAEQRVIWKALQRAIRFAQTRGTVVVASAGNDAEDTSHPTTDTTSPDFPPGNEVDREVTNACLIIPTEVPGVVGVSSTGPTATKAYYSNWGVSTVDIAAPGGDARTIGDTANGRVLSTYPGGYAYLQGTSMAGPHVAGVAALIRSVDPQSSAGTVAARLEQSATPLACPDDTCKGSPTSSSYYGAGLVNAYNAVTR
jgi:lantibiotic leader peptide-processing serine protease